jgi:hypothetical protein
MSAHGFANHRGVMTSSRLVGCKFIFNQMLIILATYR